PVTPSRGWPQVRGISQSRTSPAAAPPALYLHSSLRRSSKDLFRRRKPDGGLPRALTSRRFHVAILSVDSRHASRWRNMESGSASGRQIISTLNAHVRLLSLRGMLLNPADRQPDCLATAAAGHLAGRGFRRAA